MWSLQSFLLLPLLLVADGESSGGSGVSLARFSVFGVYLTVPFLLFYVGELDNFVISLFVGLETFLVQRSTRSTITRLLGVYGMFRVDVLVTTVSSTVPIVVL